MKLTDLIKDVGQMTEEELLEHVRQMRHNKYVAKPAKQKHIADVEKKETNKGLRSVSSLLAGMTEEQKAELIKQLGGE